ncbi:uncharacterized protein LOC120121261 isoform X3 [Hibiscus syriacus]|uniref:uncharacterized protein LOC120121261 isoform X3 n=1 Tax=Hibiscus syriacus TaxID=106335 RepID=UPI001921AA14|nr:uncharacterized protein LOC120121261 isoform X3 [Hibiscus syriacus]
MTARVSSSLEQSQNNIHTGNSGILVTKDLLGNLSKAKADLEFEAGGNRGTKVQFVITKVAIIRWENQESIDGFPKRFEASRLELSTNQPVRRNDNFTRLKAPILFDTKPLPKLLHTGQGQIRPGKSRKRNHEKTFIFTTAVTAVAYGEDDDAENVCSCMSRLLAICHSFQYESKVSSL